jgi:tyrosinase
MVSQDSSAFEFHPERGEELELASHIIRALTSHEQAFVAATRLGAASGKSGRRSLEKAALVRVRRDQATLSQAECRALKAAVMALADEGTYDRLVRLGRDPEHDRIGSRGVTGLHRFLPWNRRYLWEFETHLQRVDCRLRPNELPLAVPYWNWADPLPEWLLDFPVNADDKNSASGTTLAEAHRSGRAPSDRVQLQTRLKPTDADIGLILYGFAGQLPGASVSDFARFTFGLEGWGRRPDGSRLPAHNQVLAWLARVLDQPAGAPANPIIWLHLAQVDRLWSLWQNGHPGAGPALVGADRILDPWPETVDEMLNPLSIGYTYDI